MNKAEVIMPGAILMVPDYNGPMWTDAEIDAWHDKLMREIEEGNTDDTTSDPDGVAGV